MSDGETDLITSGAGSIGSNLADRLAGESRRARVMDGLVRRERNLQWLEDRHGDRIERFVADIRDPVAVAAAVTGVDAVFHLAAQVAVTTSMGDPPGDLNVNLIGTSSWGSAKTARSKVRHRSVASGQPIAGPRAAHRDLLPGAGGGSAGGGSAGPALLDRRQRVGRQVDAAERASVRPSGHRRSQRLQRLDLGRSERGARQHGQVGFSPATRVFEAAGAGACLITDAWEGIEMFLKPGTEILVPQDCQDVAEHLERLTPREAFSIGEAARCRAEIDHSPALRAETLERELRRLGRAARYAFTPFAA